jgi:cell division protease FtsH
VVFGHLSTGAADDLAKVTDIARDMVTRYGMVEELGYVAYEAQKSRFLDLPGFTQGGCTTGPETQGRIDEAIRTLVMDAFARTYEILTANREVLERCARELLTRETLDEAAIRELTRGMRPSAGPADPGGKQGAPAA